MSNKSSRPAPKFLGPLTPGNVAVWDDETGTLIDGGAGSGSGDVTGPASSTDNALVRFDGATGKVVQNGVITESDSGALTFPDNVRQTFNPGADAAGINVGAIAGDPGTPVDGDLWYDSAANELTARINGANVALGAGSGSGDVVGPGSSTDNALVRFDGVTGKLVQDGVITESDTGVLTFPDDIRQTFNPGTTNAGLNVGALAGDPSSPTDGDIWYDSSANELTARINGVNVALGAGAGASGYWTPLTDGDPDETELIFADGSCIMVFVPV